MTYVPPPNGLGTEKSTDNSTTTPLGSSATFTGTWEENFYPHAMVNFIADQDGTLFIDFGIDDGAGGQTTTFTQSTPVYAGQADFLAVVKGPRWIRIRFVNGAVAQTSFKLLTAYGWNFLPVSASNENEILTTTTERELDVFVGRPESNVTASKYAILIDLTDTTGFPHTETGRIDITATYFLIDRNASAQGYVRLGLITRIDGTDADIDYFSGVTFNNASDRTIVRDRRFSPSQLKMSVSGGAPTGFVTGFQETNVTAVNTGTALDSPLGTATVTPAVGDIVIAYGHTAGSYNASVSATYHGNINP